MEPLKQYYRAAVTFVLTLFTTSAFALPLSFDATTTGEIVLLETTGSVSVTATVFPPIFTDVDAFGPASGSTAGTGAGVAATVEIGEVSASQTAVAAGTVSGVGGSVTSESLTSVTYSVTNTSSPTAPTAGSATFRFFYTLEVMSSLFAAPDEFAIADSFVELNFLEGMGASVSDPLFDGLTFFRDSLDSITDGSPAASGLLFHDFTIFVDLPGSSSGFVTAVDASGVAFAIAEPASLSLLLLGASLVAWRRRNTP